MNSIIINTYNRSKILTRTLAALAGQDDMAQVEVIVVDDGSVEEYRSVIQFWEKRLNLKFEQTSHFGRSSARNRGVQIATGERIIFLGDDVVVKPGWLQRHLDLGVGNPKLAILGAYPLENAEQYPPSMQKWVDPVKLSKLPDPKNVGFKYFVTGNLSMDRQFFIELGGFDTRFKHYGWEDIDLGYRFEKAGGRLMFDQWAAAVHAHPKMSHHDLWQREYESGITAYQFWTKWQTDDLKYMKFWKETGDPGPGWRRTMGKLGIGLLEKTSKHSAKLPGMYERMVFSYRHSGVAEGKRLYGTKKG